MRTGGNSGGLATSNPQGAFWKTNQMASYFSFDVSDAISPSKGNTRNVKKLEERKTDPLSLEGYVSSTSLPKAPEKGRGGCVCDQAWRGRGHPVGAIGG